MLILLAGLVFAEDYTRTAGLELDVMGLQTSTRHDLVPGVELFAAHDARPFGLVGELALSRQVDRGDGWHFATLATRLSVVPGVSLGTHATTLQLGLGPALTMRWTTAEPDVSAVKFSPGVRGRIGLLGPLGDRFSWSWHTGVTSRGAGVDYDAGLGIGVPL
jgi:hypothetical protein